MLGSLEILSGWKKKITTLMSLLKFHCVPVQTNWSGRRVCGHENVERRLRIQWLLV